MPVHTYCSSTDHACTYICSIDHPSDFLHLAVCSLVSRALVPTTCSLLVFLCLAACSSISRALAALTSLFLDAFLVVSHLLPWNTWPHRQASFLTWIWLPQPGHAQKLDTNTLNFNSFSCRSHEQCHTRPSMWALY